MTRPAAPSAEFAYCELLRCGVTSARRHLGAVAGLGRALRQERPARVSRAGLRLGPLVSRRRPRTAVRLGRAARPRRFAAALASIDAAAAHPCGRLSRRRLADADRHLHRRPAARQPRRRPRAQPAVDRACLAERQRGARDDPPPRQDAGAMGACARHPRPGHDPRPRALSRHAIRGCAGGPRRPRILADSGTAVAHCPTPFARYGQSWRISATTCAPA